MPHEDREPQRFLGMPVPPRGWRPGSGGTEQRLFGLPRSWFKPKPIDVRWMRHPIRWTRWRIQVHRLGPFAPDYAETGSDPDPRT